MEGDLGQIEINRLANLVVVPDMERIIEANSIAQVNKVGVELERNQLYFTTEALFANV